jgi:hypothetical protein
MTTGSAHPNVVHLIQQRRYRPDLAAVARSQVASGRQRLGLTHQEFADTLAPLVGWTPTGPIVEAWETTATPPGDVLLAVGLATQSAESSVVQLAMNAGAEKVIDLLSSVLNDLERVAGSPDVVRAYAMRGLITRPEWNGIIEGAQRNIWLYGMAEMGYALDDQVPAILADAANHGCDIRVLLLDPNFAGTHDLDLDEGNPPGTLTPRIRAALARFTAMAETCETMQIRLYNAPPTVSIVRGDDRMLVTPYMRFFTGGNSPTFELQSAGGNVFDRYARHFENMWTLATEWTA